MARGGARPGAGRKPGSMLPPDIRRQPLQFRLPGWLIKWLREQPESIGRLVERALVNYYDLEQPKGRR